MPRSEKQVTVPNGIKIRASIRVGAVLSESSSELPALFGFALAYARSAMRL